MQESVWHSLSCPLQEYYNGLSSKYLPFPFREDRSCGSFGHLLRELLYTYIPSDPFHYSVVQRNTEQKINQNHVGQLVLCIGT